MRDSVWRRSTVAPVQAATPISAAGDWPAADLEAVTACPVCGAVQRSPLHDGLTDRVFHSAPGRWRLWRCADCGCGYLDPRPTEASVGRAYRSYYTHAAGDPPAARGAREALLNGYLNARWGYTLERAWPAGRLIGALAPARAAIAAREIRHLRARTRRPAARRWRRLRRLRRARAPARLGGARTRARRRGRRVGRSGRASRSRVARSPTSTTSDETFDAITPQPRNRASARSSSRTAPHPAPARAPRQAVDRDAESGRCGAPAVRARLGEPRSASSPRAVHEGRA